MTRSTICCMLFLTGGLKAPCQETFAVAMDSVQNGQDANGHSVFEAEDGLIVFGHQVSSGGGGHTRCVVYSLDQQGGYQSSYEIGSGEPSNSSYGFFDPVIRDGIAGYWGLIQRYSGFDSSIDLFKFDAQGNLADTLPVMITVQADSTILGTRQLRRTVDNGFVFCGFVDSVDTYAKALLVKLDSNGTVQWQQTYGFPSQAYEAISVAQYADGGYVLAGYRLPANLTNLGFLIRTDSAGNQIWRRHFGDEGGGWCPVRVCADGGIVVFSSYAETGWPWGWWQQLLIKYNASGGVVWQTHCNYFQNVTAYDLEVLSDQSIIGVGTYSTAIGLTKFSASGDSLWCRWLWAMSTNSFHSAYDVEPSADGGFLLTGEVSQGSTDPHPGQETIFVVKTDSLGCVVPGCQNVGVQEYAIDLQERLRVSPNPATDVVRVALDLPEGGVVQGQVQVQLLDATGRLVFEERVQQNMNKLSATLDVSALPAGTYYLHVRDAKRWLAGSKVIVE